jgi:hypothetical protein
MSLTLPLFFASGVSMALYGQNNTFPAVTYFSPFPFWVAVIRPAGLFWNQVTFENIVEIFKVN